MTVICGCHCGCGKPGYPVSHPPHRYRWCRDCVAGRHSGPLAPRPEGEYPGPTMPLPPWASEAVTKITDRSRLVIVEGRLYDKVQSGTTPDYQAVLVLATVSPHPGGRTELQPLGLVLDTHLGESVEIDDDAVMYSFVEDPG